MAETVSKSGLQSLLSGELVPLIPQPHLLKDVNELHHYLEKLHDYIRRLLAAITTENISNEPPPPLPPGEGRTIATAWRYNAATNKFQRKTTQVQFAAANAESDWADVPDGDQPEQITQVVRDVNYNSGTHSLTQDIVSVVNVLQKEADTTEAIGTITPSPLPHVNVEAIVDWRYDNTTHKWQIKTQPMQVIDAEGASDWTDVISGTHPVQLARAVTNVDYSTVSHELTEDVRADVYVLEMGAATTGINVNTATIGDCS